MRVQGKPKGAPRSAPPSEEPNNQDVFIWALYLLGGADLDIDVEAVYLKSFELAPARLGWRTHPEIPDYKKTAKALQSVEASTHVGLVQRQGPYHRRLTAEGVRWVEAHRAQLERTYSGKAPVRAAATSDHERARRRIQASPAFQLWQTTGVVEDLFDTADALECSAASPADVWRTRLEEVRRTADVTQDHTLAEFAEAVTKLLQSRGISS